MKKHHGTNAQYGLDAMCYFHHEEEGRFARIFKTLSPFYMNPCVIDELTKVGGPMDSEGVKQSATLPVGFVFLGQFIDHDVTLDTTSRLDRNNDPMATRNFRTPSLDLDCIYGAGPEASPHLYQADGIKLHTGATSTAYTGYSSANLKNHDLSRTSNGTAIIGDPRNDENRAISQLQLAFINFHNCVADHVYEEKQKEYEKKGCKGKVEIEFEEVRKLVTWHYQWIILHEFLPAFVGQPLVDEILCKGRKIYLPKSKKKGFIPIEFAAAAYRFGHSMVPLNLRFQKNGASNPLFGKTYGIGFTPLPSKKAIVDWDVLFGCGYRNFERADKLDTKLATDLLQLPFIQPPGDNNLARRNLLRGQSFLLPSGEEVAGHLEGCGIKTRYPRVKKEILTPIFKKLNHTGCTPLWFYILAEAQLLTKGQRLGPVGGRIVAETLIGLMELDSTSFLGENRQWTPTLGPKKTCSFTMCDLLHFCSPKK